MKKYLRTRLDKLDARGYATLSAVLIELDLCATQATYERAFHKAWKKVPAGSVVYCWMRPLSDPDFTAMVEGRLVQPHVTGIFLKPLSLNPDFQER
jgi:hypothetical protein